MAVENEPQSSEVQRVKAKVFRTLKDARASVCKDLNPLLRLEQAIARGLSRSTEDEIMSVLRNEHSRIALTKDRGIRYCPPPGKFKRMCEAWSFLSSKLRAEVIVQSGA